MQEVTNPGNDYRGNSSAGIIYYGIAPSFTQQRLPRSPPPHLPSVNLFAFTWKDQLTSRQPKNHGNPYAWCVTTELSVSAAHAPAYLQQAIMVYRFTVSVLTPVQLVYCMES